MGKILTRLLGFCLLVVCIAAAIFYVRLPSFLSQELSKTLKVFTSVQDVYLRPALIAIDDLFIGNVAGGILPKAFSADTIRIKAPLTRYMSDSIEIDTITVDSIYLGLEFDSPTGATGNWSALFSSPSVPKRKEKTATKVLIKTLVLSNIHVQLVYRNNPKEIKNFPLIDKIVLTNINSEEGLPIDQIMHSVLGQMLKSVFLKENIKNTLDGILNAPSDSIDRFLTPFKDLFGG